MTNGELDLNYRISRMRLELKCYKLLKSFYYFFSSNIDK